MRQVIIFYFGWVLRIKYLGSFIMSLPFLPRLAAFLVKILPRRPVRGRTWDFVCDYEGCDVTVLEAELSARRAYSGDDGTLPKQLPAELRALTTSSMGAGLVKLERPSPKQARRWSLNWRRQA